MILIDSLPNAHDYGVTGDGSDESARIKAAHDAVRAEGGRYLYFPKGCYRAPSLSEAADVIFVGEGELQLAYRKRVFSLFAPTAPTLPGGIRPAVHLRQLAKTVRGGRTAVVTLVGDSIATLADTIAPTEGIWECLQRKIRSDNPKAPFSFHHRAIGGGLWSLLDAAPPQDPGQLPPWYQNRAEPWLSYVEATQPDLLIFHLGMNDGNGLNVAARNSVIAKIGGWAKPPDIVLCTNYAPSLQHPTYRAEANMEGRDAAAGLTRSWAALNGYGLVDLNRRFNLVRDGFDPLASYLERTIANQAFTLTQQAPWQSPHVTHDLALTLQFPDAASLWGETGAGKLAIQIGRNAGNQIVFERDSGGQIAIRIDVVEGVATIPRTLTECHAPKTGALTVGLVARGGWVHAEIGGTTVFDGPCERWGGRFRPHLRVLDAPALQARGTILSLAVSRLLPFMPQATDHELFGAPGAPTGGNGINHASSHLVATIYAPVIEACDFSIMAHRT